MAGTANQPGTPGLLRAMNDRAALALLLDHGPLTRAQIGELTGLSKPTASQVVSRLEAAELIEVVGTVAATRGPSAVTYGLRGGRLHAVAVDVRPHQVVSTVVDLVGSEHPVADVPLAKVASGRSAVGDIRAAIDAACAAAGTPPRSVVTAMVGLQGAVDPRTDDLAFTGLMPGWPRRNVRAELEAGLGIPVRIDNDVNLAAVAERNDGAVAPDEDFALLWLGDGLGVALHLRGELHRGAAGGAGEIGYLPVSRSAALLDPAADDLQDVAGGIAVARVARAHGIRGRRLVDALAALPTSPARDAVLAELAPRVAEAVLPVLAVLEPHRVVLGGPTGMAGGQALADLVKSHIRRTTRWSPSISASSVPDQPVLRGARAVIGADLRDRLLDLVT
ncbi:ROK family transcriptional regulator [Cellulomonas sp. PhB150]|uniref:ROK family transcriptional regulator n=1 Tax=Cellulomonas sp. PhB150 TaxID=2485188 RepID=UPI000F474C5E|nr:ROK family transcriptional regulator [Cellulomonas sp. PhB150]ROS25977.1 putative NBD/HSP70 family sugar kinase [Cellulomonas sp. PhB150]